MFYRYIFENLASYINRNEAKAGNIGFDYAAVSDAYAEQMGEEEYAKLIRGKGLFILPSELFVNVQKRAKDGPFFDNFSGLFENFDVNNKKLGNTVTKRNERLIKLLYGVTDMDIGSKDLQDMDAIGDAYEYLMAMYALNAGKSGGEFFTPAEMSELLTRLGTVGRKKEEIKSVYDEAVA